MENSKQIIGLLNTTLKGIRLTTNKGLTEKAVQLIMEGILISITSEKVKTEFIDYCFNTYTIQLNR